MSYKAQQWTLEQSDVSGLEKWILFMLAYRDNPDDPHGCFPSIGRMARDCGVAKSTVKRALKSLSEIGKINVETRLKPDGEMDSNHYTFPQVWVGSETPHLGPHRYPRRVKTAPEVGARWTPNITTTETEHKDSVLEKFIQDEQDPESFKCKRCGRRVINSRAALKHHRCLR